MTRRRRVAAGLAAVLAACSVLTACTSAVEGHGRYVSTCRPVLFGVPGSGEGLSNPAPADHPAGVAPAAAHAYGGAVALLAAQLRRDAGRRQLRSWPIDYPAVPAEMFIGAGGLNGLDHSERAGARTLDGAILRVQRGGCELRPVLLAGYSQGAEVVVRAIGRLPAARRVGLTVALLGNPSFRPGRRGDFPPSVTGLGLRPAFTGGRAFSLPSSVQRRTIDVCAPGDPICDVPRSPDGLGRIEWVLRHLAVHTNAYRQRSSGLTERAAQFLWAHRLR